MNPMTAAEDAQAAPGIPGMGASAAAPPGGTAAFDLRLLKWMEAEKIDGFVNWTSFKHPTLGDVEIGGFRPYACSNPPAAKLAELGSIRSSARSNSEAGKRHGDASLRDS